MNCVKSWQLSPFFFQITGNLLLMIFYGAILGIAAKCISGKSCWIMPMFSKSSSKTKLGCFLKQFNNCCKVKVKKFFIHVTSSHWFKFTETDLHEKRVNCSQRIKFISPIAMLLSSLETALCRKVAKLTWRIESRGPFSVMSIIKPGRHLL